MFIMNAWYVAARSSEIKNGPLGRRICNQPMVLYRDSNSRVYALEDFCPHRGLPLSLGTVQGDSLVCGYHGLVMGCDGLTQSMPKQCVDRFPEITSYACEERHNYIWIWPGEKALADPTKIPDYPWLNAQYWTHGGDVFHIKADYRLMIDNLMDLTHENYVHSASIGQKEIDEQPVRTRRDGDAVITERQIPNVIAPPFWQAAMRQQYLDPNAEVDRWQVCRFVEPSNIHIDVGVALAGKGGINAPLEQKVRAVVSDFITPETEKSHFYFWGMARSWALDDPEVTEKIKHGQRGIFSEDLEILESQQRSLNENAGRQLLMLDIDAGGAQARKLIKKRIEQESGVQF